MPDTTREPITAAHDPNIQPDEIGEVRQQAEHYAAAGDPAGVYALLVQALDDLEGAYARINVSYRRLDDEADRIKTLRDELDAIGNLAYRGGDRETLTDALAAIHTRAKAAAARMDPQT